MKALAGTIRRAGRRLLPQYRSVRPALSSADLFLVSYPKTGRTWLRMLIGRYLCERYSLDESRVLDTPWLTTQAGLHSADFTHDGSNLKKERACRDYVSAGKAFADRRVLLLTRCIEDTMVSAWFQVTKRLQVYNGSISEMLRDDRFGVEKFVRFYQTWYQQQRVPVSFALMSYEEMHADPAAALRQVLAFLGETDIDETTLTQAVEFCAFENMRRIESSQKLDQKAMQPGDPGDTDSHKVRRGVVGGFVDYLSDSDIDYVRRQAAAADCPFVRLAVPHGRHADVGHGSHLS